MAEEKAPDNVVYVRDDAGQTIAVTPEQAARFDPTQILSKPQASNAYQAESNEAAARELLGTGLGPAAAGFVNELGVGIPAAAAGAIGERYLSPEDSARLNSALSGMSSLPGYGIGGAAGMVLPAFLSGGESLGARAASMAPLEIAGRAGERLAERFLPEAAGIMGTAARGAVKMAARGAYEGALLEAGHQIQESVLQNKPLTAESFVANVGEGALFGALFGGGFGAVGEVLGGAAKVVGSRVGGMGGESTVLKRLGYTASDLQGMDREARLKLVEEAGGIFKSKGKDFTAPTESLSKAAKEAAEDFAKVKSNVIQRLEREAPVSVPKAERLTNRLQDELVGPVRGTINELSVQKYVDKLSDELYSTSTRKGLGSYVDTTPSTGKFDLKSGKILKTESSGPAPFSGPEEMGQSSWKRIIDSRDQLAQRAAKGNPLDQQALAVLDNEIATAIEGAEQSYKIKGIAEEFKAATAGNKLAKELEDITAKKSVMDSMGGPSLSGKDAITMLGMAAVGHPVYAASLILGRQAGHVLERKLSPAIAQMAYDNAMAAKLGASVANGKSRIKDGVKKFFSSAGKSSGPYTYSIVRERKHLKGMDRKAIDKDIARTRELLGEEHRVRVNQYLSEQMAPISPELAAAAMEVYGRAAQYMSNNMPTSHSAVASTTLKKSFPKANSFDIKEIKFLQIKNVLSDPFSYLENPQDMTLTESRALQSVYPELFAEMVDDVQEAIFEMKQAGGYLPVEKITQLGIVLNTPVDTFLEPTFVNTIQSTFVQPEQQQQQQSSGPSQSMLAPAIMTPIDQMVM